MWKILLILDWVDLSKTTQIVNFMFNFKFLWKIFFLHLHLNHFDNDPTSCVRSVCEDCVTA